MPEVVLVLGLGLPERACLADLGHDLAGPQACGVGVGDRVPGDLALLVARIEDLGTVVGTDMLFAKVGPVDLEEELEDGPVGGSRGIEDDLDRLGMTRVVAGGRVVVLSAGVADAGRDDPVAVAQQFRAGQKQPPARIAVSVFSLIAVLTSSIGQQMGRSPWYWHHTRRGGVGSRLKLRIPGAGPARRYGARPPHRIRSAPTPDVGGLTNLPRHRRLHRLMCPSAAPPFVSKTKPASPANQKGHPCSFTRNP